MAVLLQHQLVEPGGGGLHLFPVQQALVDGAGIGGLALGDDLPVPDVLLPEGGAGLPGLVLPGAGGLVQLEGHLRHGHGVGVGVGGVRQLGGAQGRSLGRAPVPQAEVHQAVHGHGGEVVHVLHHVGPELLDQGQVPGVAPHVVGDQDQGAVPGRAAAPVVAPAACGNDPRQLAAGPLAVHKVPEPLAVGVGHVEVQQGLLRGELGVAGPAVLLPVGAVGGDAVEVGEGGPPGGLVNLVEQLVAAGELSHGLQVRVDLPALHGEDLGLGLHPDVAEAVVAEVGLPALGALPFQEVPVVVGEFLRAEAVHVLGVKGAVGVQALAVEQVHLGACLSRQGDPHPAGGVLPQVIHPGEDLFRLQGAHHPDGGQVGGL